MQIFYRPLNRVRKFLKLWQIMEFVGLCGVVSWSWSRVLKVAPALYLKLYGLVFNHHVVFLIGNAIIVVLYFLCRRSSSTDAVNSVDGDFYSDHVRHSESFSRGGGDDVADTTGGDVFLARPIPRRCDGVAEAIDRASRQIKRFERTQSERLRKEIAQPRTAAEMRRSSTGIEGLDGEEFRRAIDAFIEEHWSRKGARREDEFERYQPIKVA